MDDQTLIPVFILEFCGYYVCNICKVQAKYSLQVCIFYETGGILHFLDSQNILPSFISHCKLRRKESSDAYSSE